MESPQQASYTHLDIMIPGLFDGLANWPEMTGEHKNSRALEWLLSRGNFLRQEAIGSEINLLRCFDPELKQDEELPIAALRMNSPGTPSLCADPVHLQFGATDIELFSGPDLMLSRAESEEIVALLNDFFKEDGFNYLLDEKGWGTLFLDESADIKTTALSLVHGRMLTEKLPSGPDQSRWHKLSNEIQMLFHDAAFNQKRVYAGKLTINALWFWGVGELIRPFKSDYQLIVSDDHLAKLLANKTDTNNIPVSESFDELLEKLPNGKNLLVLDKLLAFSQKNDYLGWARQLEQYEQQWFKSINEYVRSKQINSISILTSTGECFNYLPQHRWRFWRKKHDLQDWVNK